MFDDNDLDNTPMVQTRVFKLLPRRILEVPREHWQSVDSQVAEFLLGVISVFFLFISSSVSSLTPDSQLCM